jgi:hypothetical protein
MGGTDETPTLQRMRLLDAENGRPEEAKVPGLQTRMAGHSKAMVDDSVL